MNQKLKKCPFCGSKARVNDYSAAVECSRHNSCGAMTAPNYDPKDWPSVERLIEKSVRAWNRRAGGRK